MLNTRNGEKKLCEGAIAWSRRTDMEHVGRVQTDADGYTEPAATHMLLLVKRNRLRGKLEFLRHEQIPSIATVKWIVAVGCGQQLYEQFERIMRHIGMRQITLYYIKVDNLATAAKYTEDSKRRARFFEKNGFVVYSTKGDPHLAEVFCIKQIQPLPTAELQQ